MSSTYIECDEVRGRLRPKERRCARQVGSFLTKFSIFYVLSGILSFSSGQIRFEDLIKSTNSNHPSLKTAVLAAQASKQDVEAIKRRKWPAISMAVEAASTDKGSFPSQTLGVEQILWDFGSLESKVSESEQASVIAELAIQSERRRLHIEVANAWQALIGAMQRVEVGNEALKTLAEYQEMMTRRVNAEVSPAIDLEVVASRTLSVEVEVAQARSAISSALIKLRQLTGLSNLDAYALTQSSVKAELEIKEFGEQAKVADWSLDIERHPVVLKAKYEAKLNEFRLKAKRSEQWPQIYARINQPLDTGTGAANERTMQGVAYVGIRYTPGAGFASSAEVSSMASRLASSYQAVDVAKSDIAESVRLEVNEFQNSLLRHQSQVRAVQSSKKVLESYKSQFVAGKKTWQDVLNAVRELTASQYLEKDAWIAIQAGMRRIQAKAGVFERMYE